MKAFQILICFFLTVGVLRMLYQDINGRDAKASTGFSGVVTTILITGLMFFVYYQAGAFSCLFK